MFDMERDQLEELFGAEWAEWMRLTPQQRWAAQEQMWATYLALGGSLAPEFDPQSPFHETYTEYELYDSDDKNLEAEATAVWRAATKH